MKKDKIFISFVILTAVIICLDIAYLIFVCCNAGFFIGGKQVISSGMFAFSLVVFLLNLLLLVLAIMYYFVKRQRRAE